MSDPSTTKPFQDNTAQPRGGNPQDDLREATAATKQAAGAAASQVKAEATAAAQTLKQEGAALLDTARDRAEHVAREGAQAGAAQASGVARAIKRAAEELRTDSPRLADTVRDAAGALDGMAHALREKSPAELLRGAEDFARRQPLAFVGLATLAGFALARFARASTPKAQASSRTPTQIGTAHPRAPGWRADEAGTPRPATLASASLGGAAAYRARGGSENG